MMKMQQIRELIKIVDQSSLDEFKYENEDVKIFMKKNNQGQVSNVVTAPQVQPAVETKPAPAVEQQPAVQKKETVQEQADKQDKSDEKEIKNENLHKITSPMVGTFYRAPAPDADPYVEVGSKVKSDTVVCIVEAMKLFNEIEAEVEGEIVDILVENGQLVEFGQPLFLVKLD